MMEPITKEQNVKLLDSDIKYKTEILFGLVEQENEKKKEIERLDLSKRRIVNEIAQKNKSLAEKAEQDSVFSNQLTYQAEQKLLEVQKLEDSAAHILQNVQNERIILDRDKKAFKDYQITTERELTAKIVDIDRQHEILESKKTEYKRYSFDNAVLDQKLAKIENNNRKVQNLIKQLSSVSIANDLKLESIKKQLLDISVERGALGTEKKLYANRQKL